jgi:hypothetical protein
MLEDTWVVWGVEFGRPGLTPMALPSGWIEE